jgi:superfamily II DNA or RNA helicase
MIEQAATRFFACRRLLAVLPTGGGKTVIFTIIADRAAAKGKRVYIVAHRQEIVDQISRALDFLGVRHGRIQPGHTMTTDLCQVAMVQTLARRIEKVPACDLLILDEAHHGVAGTWRTVTQAWPSARILGVTATPQRMDGRGLSDAFDQMIVGPSMRDLIDAGFLANYTYLAPPERADISKVPDRAGDFAINELASVMDKSVITGDAVSHYRTHLDGRPAIVFCVTVEHAQHVAAQFCDAGFRAASVDGKMEMAERRDVIASIGDGRLQVLTSCDLISEGVDVPTVAGAILLRPTKSLGMFLQQIGRALRPKPDGLRAIVLDHVGNVARHGLPDAPRAWSLTVAKKKQPGAPPIMQCKVCFRVFGVHPGWKAEHDPCGSDDPDCALADRETAGKTAPEQIAGDLVAVTPSPDWTEGISITAAKGDEWKRLLRLADTAAKLHDIARARNYKPAWVHYILQQRQKRGFAGAPVPFVPPAKVETPIKSDPQNKPPPQKQAELDLFLDDMLNA